MIEPVAVVLWWTRRCEQPDHELAAGRIEVGPLPVEGDHRLDRNPIGEITWTDAIAAHDASRQITTENGKPRLVEKREDGVRHISQRKDRRLGERPGLRETVTANFRVKEAAGPGTCYCAHSSFVRAIDVSRPAIAVKCDPRLAIFIPTQVGSCRRLERTCALLSDHPSKEGGQLMPDAAKNVKKLSLLPI